MKSQLSSTRRTRSDESRQRRDLEQELNRLLQQSLGALRTGSEQSRRELRKRIRVLHDWLGDLKIRERLAAEVVLIGVVISAIEALQLDFGRSQTLRLATKSMRRPSW
jgi:hypothetical protein